MLDVCGALFEITPSPSKPHIGSDAYFSVYLFCVLRKLIKQPFHRSAPQSVSGYFWYIIYLCRVEQKGANEQVECVFHISYARQVRLEKVNTKWGVYMGASFWYKVYL